MDKKNMIIKISCFYLFYWHIEYSSFNLKISKNNTNLILLFISTSDKLV